MRISINQDAIDDILAAEEPDYWHERGLCYRNGHQIPALATGQECPVCGYKLSTLPPYTRAALLAAAKRAANNAAKRAATAATRKQQADLPF